MQKLHTANIVLFTVGAASLLSAASGCQGVKQSSNAKPSQSPYAKPSPSGLSLEAQLGNLDLTLIDEKGRTIAEVTAKAGSVGPGKAGTPTGAVVGALNKGTAILYQEGKPSAKLTADSLQADKDTRTVVATGNAVVTSLADPNTPAIRADTMTWKYDPGTIHGTGNVLVTRKPDLRVPGASFTADTRLRKFTLKGGAGSATGTF